MKGVLGQRRHEAEKSFARPQAQNGTATIATGVVRRNRR